MLPRNGDRRGPAVHEAPALEKLDSVLRRDRAEMHRWTITRAPLAGITERLIS